MKTHNGTFLVMKTPKPHLYSKFLYNFFVWFVGCLISIQTFAAATPPGITYTGRILDSNNEPVVSSDVRFTIYIFDADKKCWLYREQRQISLDADANGTFAFDIGSASSGILLSQTFNGQSVGGPETLADVFNNHKTFTSLNTTPVGTCTGTYTPNPTNPSAERYMSVQFQFGAAGTPQYLPELALNPVPSALQAYAVNGYDQNHLLRISPSVTTPTSHDLSSAELAEFWALIGGTSLNFLKPNAAFTGDVTGTYNATVVEKIRGRSVVATAPANGDVLKWNGTAWAPAADSTGTSSDAAYGSGNKGIVAFDTDAATSGISVTTGVARVNSGTGANQIVKLDASSKLPAVDGSALTGVVASSIADNSVTSAKIVDGTIVNADISGTAAIAWSKINVAAADLTTTLGYTPLNKAGDTMGGNLNMGGNKITGLKNVPNVAADPAVGQDGQSLRWNQTAGEWQWFTASAAGAGITSLNGESGNSQSFGAIDLGTSVTAPGWSSATNVHTLKIPMAADTGVTAGLITKTQYDSFVAKLTNPLTTKGDIVVRDGTAPTRLAVGTNNQVLSADSTEATGLKWIDLPSGLPTQTGHAGEFLTTNATTASWTALPVAAVGTKGIMEVGTGLAVTTGTVSADYTTTGTASKLVMLDGSGVANVKGLEIQTGTGKATLQTSGAFTNYSLTLPTTPGTANQVLTTAGASGILSWTDPTDTTKLPLAGGTMAGNIAMGGNKITGMKNVPNVAADPAVGQDGQSLRWNQTAGEWQWFTAAASGAGITSLNGESGNSQTFGAIDLGTSVTAPGWSSATNVHTLKIPMAADTGVTGGLITKTQYDSFVAKLTSPMTTKGDLLVHNGTNHARLAVGTDNHVLVADAAAANGVKWAALPASVTSIATNNGLTGGTITSTGTIGLASIGANTLLANATGSAAVPTATSISDVIDGAIGNTRGAVLYRGAAGWSVLAPGTSGDFLKTAGAGADPSWASVPSSLPTQTGNNGKYLTTTGTSASWADAVDATKLPLAGGTMAGDIAMGGNKITGLTNVPNVAANPAAGQTGQALRWNNGTPAWEWFTPLDGSSSLDASKLTGQVAIANGGTGAATKADGFNALSPLTTKGDLIAYSAAGSGSVRLPVGTNDYVLVADSTTDTGLKWSAIPAALPTQTGHAGEFLTTNATSASWSALPVAAVGTKGIMEVGTGLAVTTGTVSADYTTTGTASKLVMLDGSGVANVKGLEVQTGTGKATLQTSGAFTNYSLTLPTSSGSANQVLTTNGAGGILSWSTVLTDVSATATLAGGKIWVGDSGGKAAAVSLSGDISSVSDTGSVTLATVGIAKGGTGQTSKTAAFDALSPTTTKGDIIVNNGTNNIRLAAGTNDHVLVADSTAASGVKWAAVPASVTSIATNNGLTGGTITSTGTIGLASIGANTLLANATGSAAVPTATSISDVIDGAIGNTRGAVLYRGAAGWSVLAPGTSGDFLKTAGAGADPSWASVPSSLPTQTGNNGKYLTTNGTSASWADAVDATKLPLNGGTMSGNIAMGGNKITGMTNVPNVAANPAAGQTGQALRWNNGTPAWEWFTPLDSSSSLDASKLTGQVAIANGGTGASTKTAGFNALSPLTTKGDLVAYSAAATGSTRLPAGTNDYVLTADSTTDTGLKWAAIPASLPTQTGHAGEFLTTNATSASWSALPVATKGAQGLMQVGSGLTVSSGTVSADYTTSGTASKLVMLDGSGVANVKGLEIQTGSGKATLQTTGAFTNYTLTLPTSSGTANQVLTTNGAGGVLSWSSVLTDVSATANLAGGKIWVGDAGGKAAAVSLGGDISSVSNTGSVTLNTVGVAKGGTGATTLTSGALLVGAGTSAVTSLAGTATGNVVYATSATAWASGTPDTAGLVDKASTQTIAGAKTFSSVVTSTVAAGSTAITATGNISTAGQIVGGAKNDNTTGAINFTYGNVQTTSYDCSGNITFSNMQSGGSYTLVVTNTGTAQCNLYDGATQITKFVPANAPRTSGKETVYTMIKVGTTVYVSWIAGY